jgi:hypothetical protein
MSPGSNCSPPAAIRDAMRPSNSLVSKRILAESRINVNALLASQNLRKIRYNISIINQNRGLKMEKLNLYKLSKFDRRTAFSASRSIYICNIITPLIRNRKHIIHLLLWQQSKIRLKNCLVIVIDIQVGIKKQNSQKISKDNDGNSYDYF